MSLNPGTRLGAYEIVALIGAGGMGEVYRARDTRLGRDVAIKVLPEAFAQDADRLARFKREAQVLASLNHPHIGGIYGLEESGPAGGSDAQDPPYVRALVLEFIDGPTLADRIAQGPIPVDEALPIARQIADALEAAHEQGIIHRDLKPANIKLTPAGSVKVLDFGLAKAMDVTAGSAKQDPAYGLSASPTLTSPAMTMGGVILGTAAYMSPEQAKGLPADRRSDIFAFGAVLYEMLTGRQPFKGDTAPDVLASVLVRDPDLNALPTNFNPRLVDLLKRCLDKHPKKRWQAIGDVRAEIDTIALAPFAPVVTPASSAPRALWRRMVPIAAAAILGGVIVGIAVWRFRAPRAVPSWRFSLELPPDQDFSSVSRPVMAISPDGTMLAYVANQRLYLRSMTSLDAKVIPGTNVGPLGSPVFSPDSRDIAFLAAGNQSIERIAITGGTPAKIYTGPGITGLTWTGNGILFSEGAGGIKRVGATGGTPELVASVQPGEVAYAPQLLPDGDSLLFTISKEQGANRWDTARIVVQSMKSGVRKTLVEGGRAGLYVPGYLAYAVGTELLAVRFDAERLEVIGGPTPVLPDVMPASALGAMQLSVSMNGTLGYVRSSYGDLKARLALRPRDGGAPTPVSDWADNPRYPRASPDGRRVAVTLGPGQEGDIWVYDLQGSRQPVKLTFNGHDIFPVWTRDSRHVFYLSEFRLFSVAADGSEAPKAAGLASGDPGAGVIGPHEFSPDGLLMLSRSHPKTGRDLLLWSPHEPATPLRNWLNTESYEGEARFSADGKFVVYTSDSTGDFEIWVRPYPGPGAPVRLSREGGREPAWSPDGTAVYFQDGNRMMSAGILSTTPEFRAGPPQELFTGGFLGHSPSGPRSYDVARDGRFVLVQPSDTPQDRRGIVIVQNWFEDLKRLAPGK